MEVSTIQNLLKGNLCIEHIPHNTFNIASTGNKEEASSAFMHQIQLSQQQHLKQNTTLELGMDGH